jgi:hypothetical protein
MQAIAEAGLALEEFLIENTVGKEKKVRKKWKT